jgi:hypothetical protein
MTTADAVPRILAAVLIVLGAAPARGDQDAAAVRGQLHAATYRASTLGHAARGAAIWLQDAAGNLRLELDQQPAGPDLDAAALLTQRGQGWTVVLAATGAGTVNAWGEPWRTVPAGLGAAVRLTTAALQEHKPTGGDDGPPATGRNAAWRAGRGRPQAERHPIAPVVAADSSAVVAGRAWRAGLAETGLGRGPGGELLVLTWRPGEATAAPRLEARLSGRPGRIVLTGQLPDTVSYYTPEVFVPLWPLGDALVDTP